MTEKEATEVIRALSKVSPRPFDTNIKHRVDGETRVRYEVTFRTMAEAQRVLNRDLRPGLLDYVPRQR